MINYAQNHDVSLLPVDQLKEVTGKGVSGRVDGKTVQAGKLTYVTEGHEDEKMAQTGIYVSVDGQYLGKIAFQDHIRSEAKATMQALHKYGVRNLMILTGDQVAIAQKVADQVGINQVKADLLPQDKIAALKSIPQSEHPVFMVGDGVNDAPSLATADVGIAMGAHGSSAASESAAVVILKDDLMKVAKAVDISQDTLKIAKQAVLIGIAVCTVLMIIASSGIIPAFVGAMLQEVVDTVSILWALRARKAKEITA